MTGTPHNWTPGDVSLSQILTDADHLYVEHTNELRRALDRHIWVDDLGAVGDGVTDDYSAFQTAIDLVGIYGGYVHINPQKKYYLGSTITVNKGCALVGELVCPGNPGNTNSDTDYSNFGSRIILKSTATVSLKGSAGIKNIFVTREGLTFPEDDVSDFAGTAITISGEDAYVGYCLIFGFAYAIRSTGHQRLTCESVKGDCTNGIDVDSSWDIARLSDCHFWPYLTVSSGTPPNALLQRAGIGFHIANGSDVTMMRNCFAYGYWRGFFIEDNSYVTALNCSADGYASERGEIGFVVQDGGYETLLLGCSNFNQVVGISVAVNTGSVVQIQNGVVSGATEQGILVSAGSAFISGNLIRASTKKGVQVIGTGHDVFINGNYFLTGGGNAIDGGSKTNIVAMNNFSKDITPSPAITGVTVNENNYDY
jgi:hypothetical protein